MYKEFDANVPVELPEDILCKKIDGYWIAIAPKYPNWIVLDDDEYQMFSGLRRQLSPMDTMNEFYSRHALPEERVLQLMTKLLGKIEETDFYKSTHTSEETPVESISKLIHIILTNNCNLRCPHCYMSAGRLLEQKLDITRLLDFLERINDINGVSEIVISGGEPLKHEHVLELLETLHRKGNKLALFTNGTLINRNNYKLIGRCCDEVQVSFEGITQKFFEQVRGRGNYRRVMSALELLKSTGIRLTLAITILPTTLDDVRDNLTEFVQALHYDNLEVRLNHRLELSGNALTLDMSGYDRKTCDEIVLHLMRELEASGIRLDYSSERNVRFTNCGIGTNLVINFDGKIYPCSKFGAVHFDISDNVSEILRRFDELNRETSNNFMAKCRACELRYICLGGCRLDNYNASGDMLMPTCDDEFKREVYRRLIFEYLRG